MKIHRITVSLLLFILLSCKKDNSTIGIEIGFEPGPPGSFSYLSYDSLGSPVVSGWLQFEFTDSVRIKGSWQLKNLTGRSDLGPQTGEGELVGSIKGSSISMELNPGVIDNNLGLSGTLSGTRIEGEWFWISFVGITNWGTFKAAKN
jgi:hypothetical protein